jgi:hypothetical protein
VGLGWVTGLRVQIVSQLKARHISPSPVQQRVGARITGSTDVAVVAPFADRFVHKNSPVTCFESELVETPAIREAKHFLCLGRAALRGRDSALEMAESSEPADYHSCSLASGFVSVEEGFVSPKVRAVKNVSAIVTLSS